MRALQFTTFAAVLALAACSSGDKKTESNGSLATDSALAADLKQAGDTAAYTEAADVAMRDIPDSTLPMPPSRPMTTNPGGQATIRTPAQSPAPTTAPASTPAPARPATPRAAPVAAPRAAPAAAPLPERQPPMRPSPANDTRPSIAKTSPMSPRTMQTVPYTAGAGTSDSPTPACESPARDDQRRCLLAYLARSDAGLNRAYQAEISLRKQEAGTRPGAPEPESVQRLRAAQRAWLVYRDTECRKRTRGSEGPLWAPTRARCLGEFSAARAAELNAR